MTSRRGRVGRIARLRVAASIERGANVPIEIDVAADNAMLLHLTTAVKGNRNISGYLQRSNQLCVPPRGLQIMEIRIPIMVFCVVA